MGNLIDVWFPFRKIYIKQTWQTKKSELQEWQTQGVFSLVHAMIYQVLGRLKEEGVLSGHPCRWFQTWLPFHGYGKIKLLLFLGSHPTTKNKYMYIFNLYTKYIKVFGSNFNFERLLWRVWLWWNLVVVCWLCFTWAKLHWNAWAAEWFGLSKPSQLDCSPVNLC